jgi:hypothetical protein
MTTRPLSPWRVGVIALALLLFTAYVVGELFESAPEPETLARSTVTLAAPVELVSASGKSRGPYAVLAWAGGKATVEYLCFLSGCVLPAPLAGLKAGDNVTLLTSSDSIWQVEHGGHVALHYDDVRAAYDQAMRRRCQMSIPLWAAAVGLLAVVLARPRKLRNDS